MENAVKTHVRDYSARRTYSPRHRAVLRAFCEALFFAEEQPFAPGELDALVENCEKFVSYASKTLRFGLRLVLDVIRWLPLFLVGKWAAFEDLSRADRVVMLERMDRARIPLVTLLLVAYKTILAMLFFEDPRELAATGYPGPERFRYKRGLPAVNGTTAANGAPNATPPRTLPIAPIVPPSP